MAEFIDNCGYWLYLGENDVPKTDGKIKPIAVDLEDSGSWDLSGRPVLDFDANPLANYTESKSVPRILTRAEKGQALTHLEMDFNLASLLHKANTSSVSSSFAENEDSSIGGTEDPARVPYKKVPCPGSASRGQINHVPQINEYQGGFYGNKTPVIYGPYLIPSGCRPSDYNPVGNTGYCGKVESGGTLKYYQAEQSGSFVSPSDTINLTYDIFIPLSVDPETGFYEGMHPGETFYHLEELNGTASYVPFAGVTPEEYGINGDASIGYGTDVYFERHKPTRDEEHNGLFATFSYAPVKNDKDTIIQNGFQTIKIQHTSDEVRYKLANERVPGTLDVREDFHVSGSTFVFNDVFVTGSTHIEQDLHVTHSVWVAQSLGISGSALIHQDARISGSLFVKGDTEISGSERIVNNLAVSGNTFLSKSLYANALIVTESMQVNGVTLVISGNNITMGSRNNRVNVEIYGNFHVYSGSILGSINDPSYNSLENPNYATVYNRFGTQDTGSQSDARLKLNPMPIWDPLYKLGQITGYEFEWAPEAEKQGHDVGLIAQELQAVLPDAVGEGQDGYLRIDYTKVVPLLVEAVKKLREEVEWLRNRVQ